MTMLWPIQPTVAASDFDPFTKVRADRFAFLVCDQPSSPLGRSDGGRSDEERAGKAIFPVPQRFLEAAGGATVVAAGGIGSILPRLQR